MRHSIFTLVFCLAAALANAQSSGYALSKTFKIGSTGGWDYIAVAPDGKIFASHGTQVNILDPKTGDSLGVIPNTTGVHGIAFDASLGKGYTSNGRLNTVTVFDLKTFPVLGQIPTTANPPPTIPHPSPHTTTPSTCPTHNP